LAQSYAMTNRELMMAATTAIRAAELLPAFTADAEVVHCHHNYVAIEEHYGERVFVTRKGAVRARWRMRVSIPYTRNRRHRQECVLCHIAAVWRLRRIQMWHRPHLSKLARIEQISMPNSQKTRESCGPTRERPGQAAERRHLRSPQRELWGTSSPEISRGAATST
jgi:hypothetical protein